MWQNFYWLQSIRIIKAKQTDWDADVENGLVDTAGEGEGGVTWERSTDTNRLPCVKQTAGATLP